YGSSLHKPSILRPTTYETRLPRSSCRSLRVAYASRVSAVRTDSSCGELANAFRDLEFFCELSSPQCDSGASHSRLSPCKSGRQCECYPKIPISDEWANLPIRNSPSCNRRYL